MGNIFTTDRVKECILLAEMRKKNTNLAMQYQMKQAVGLGRVLKAPSIHNLKTDLNLSNREI